MVGTGRRLANMERSGDCGSAIGGKCDIFFILIIGIDLGHPWPRLKAGERIFSSLRLRNILPYIHACVCDIQIGMGLDF